VLATQGAEDKVSHVSSVSAAVSKKVSAGVLIGEVAKLVGGRGGGRPDFAQAGGNDPSKLEAALQAVPKLVADKLGGT
jgi:alanyl-tRNA synthetase